MPMSEWMQELTAVLKQGHLQRLQLMAELPQEGPASGRCSTSKAAR